MTHDYISALDSTHQRVYFKTLAIIIVFKVEQAIVQIA